MIVYSPVSLGQASFRSLISGAWNDPSTWVRDRGTDVDGVPDENDTITLVRGTIVTLTVGTRCKKLSLQGNGTLNIPAESTPTTLTILGTLIMNGDSRIKGTSNASIDLIGDFIIPEGQTGNIEVWIKQTGNFKLSGTFNYSGMATSWLGDATIEPTGQLNILSREILLANCQLKNGAVIDGNYDHAKKGSVIIEKKFLVSPGLPGQTAKIGKIKLFATNRTDIDGHLVFTAAGSGSKIFKKIVVSSGGTWDNTVGEQITIWGDIINDGFWPAPMQGSGEYIVDSGGRYTFSGSSEIGMTRLKVAANSSVTNFGRLNLTGTSGALTVQGGAVTTFVNGREGHVKFTSAGKPISVTSFENLDFTAATNTVEYAATDGIQDLYPATYSNLIINNSRGVILVGGRATIKNSLALAKGEFDLNGNTLNIDRASTEAISRTSGYIRSETSTPPYGVVRWNTATSEGPFIFPFGLSATEYIPFTFNITRAGSRREGSVAVATYHTGFDNQPLPAPVVSLPDHSGANTVDRFWIIKVENYSGNPTSEMTFTATANEVGSITGLKAYRWGTGSWGQPTFSSQTNTSFSATISGVASYSPWTLVGDVPLPVELLDLRAVEGNGEVEIKWITATESNNAYFAVERSANGVAFEELGKVDGAGDSRLKLVYKFADKLPLPGLSFYRLKQTDTDGTSSHSKVISVEVQRRNSVVLFPNPSNGTQLEVWLPDEREHHVVISIFDVKGKKLFAWATLPGDVKKLSLDLTNRLDPGIYVVVVENGPVASRHRLLIAN
ncbi:MAG: T9SS type A sorting domain-containing protein [Bacteroidota bacterium]